MHKIFMSGAVTATGTALPAPYLGLASILITTFAASPAWATSCNFRNGEIHNGICGYSAVASGSAKPGGQLRLHVSSDTSNFIAHLDRVDNDAADSQTFTFQNGQSYGIPSNGYLGLNWGSGHVIPIPSQWKSGVYEVNLKNALGTAKEYITIRSANPGSHSKVLVIDSLPTVMAYDPIGGKSLYGFNSDGGAFSSEVSIERPSVAAMWSEHIALIKWLENKGIAYESASMMDLHRDSSLLKQYNLAIIVGHNEYWSQEMRDNWDSYIAGGGNAMILGGNTMWWRVRFSPDNKNMICYKYTADPYTSKPSGLFSGPLVNEPENTSTGVSFRHGGYADYTENGVNYYKYGINDNGSNGGFKVTDATHWVFSGTGLANNSLFGRGTSSSDSIAGYEVDGTLFKMVSGKPVATGLDGTPANFQILATTPAYAVNSPSGTPGYVANNYNSQGWGTMGIFKPSSTSGTVFVAPTVDWAKGLTQTTVSRITQNAINTLKVRSSTGSGSTDTGGTSGNTNSGNTNSGNTNSGTSSGSTASGSTSNTSSSGSGGSGSTSASVLLLGTLALLARRRKRV